MSQWRTDPLIPSLILFLFSNITYCETLSFNLNGSQVLSSDACNRSQNAICLKGDASFKEGKIELTGYQSNGPGWAFYTQKLNLRDKTGESTNFTTVFSLQVASCVFLLSLYPPSSKFVAVEFGTKSATDYNDPYCVNIGININSRRSNQTIQLCEAQSVMAGTAILRYDAGTRNFSVLYFDTKSNKRHVISEAVDLRTILPESVFVGFYASPSYYELNRITSWKFNTTLDVPSQERHNSTGTGDPKAVGNGSTTHGGTYQLHNGSMTRARARLVAGMTIGFGFIMVMVMLVLFGLWKKRNTRKAGREQTIAEFAGNDVHGYSSIDQDIENDNGLRMFSYNELAVATESFSGDKKLGSGGSGSVYRGFLWESDRDVAIKRIPKDSKQGMKEHISRIKAISQLQHHQNLVRLVGWGHEGKDLLLVYDFVPNGSLYDHLFGERMATLSWPARYNIALGLASALLHLHTEGGQCFIHGNVKSSNIMLDSDFNPKLGDFELKLVYKGSKKQSNINIGMLGSMAPECLVTGRYSTESDIYGFGVVLLELACGRRAIDEELQRGNDRLVDWVSKIYEIRQTLEVVDPRLEGQYEKDQMKWLIMIGLWCANSDPHARPSIKKVIEAFNFDVTLMPSCL